MVTMQSTKEVAVRSITVKNAILNLRLAEWNLCDPTQNKAVMEFKNDRTGAAISGAMDFKAECITIEYEPLKALFLEG